MISKGKFFGIVFFLAYIILTYISLQQNIMDFIGSGTQQPVSKTQFIKDSKYAFLEKKDEKVDKNSKKKKKMNKDNWGNSYSENLLSLKPNVKTNLSLHSKKTNSTTGLISYLSTNYKINDKTNTSTAANSQSLRNSNYNFNVYSNSAINSFHQGRNISNGNTQVDPFRYKNQLTGLNHIQTKHLEDISKNAVRINSGFTAINTDFSTMETSFQSIDGSMQKVSSDIDPGDGDGDMGNPIPVGDGWIFMMLLAAGYSLKVITRAMHAAKSKIQQ